MATILIGNRPAQPDELKSFAFYQPASQQGLPENGRLALLRVDFISGEMVVVRGADAVTLKVLLSAMGYTDLSSSWHPIQRE
jgi:hypothetical protein